MCAPVARKPRAADQDRNLRSASTTMSGPKQPSRSAASGCSASDYGRSLRPAGCRSRILPPRPTGPAGTPRPATGSTAFRYVQDQSVLRARLEQALRDADGAALRHLAWLEIVVHRDLLVGSVHLWVSTKLDDDAHGAPPLESLHPSTEDRNRASADVAMLLRHHPEHATALAPLPQTVLYPIPWAAAVLVRARCEKFVTSIPSLSAWMPGRAWCACHRGSGIRRRRWRGRRGPGGGSDGAPLRFASRERL
jgi:hypothetical protein